MDDKEECERMRVLFYEKLNEILAKKCSNNQIFSKERYNELFNKVKVAQTKTSHKLPKEYHLLRVYKVETINGEERLIYPQSFYGGAHKIYVHTAEVFDILYETHQKINHGGREKMVQELHKCYRNVTQEQVTLYLSLCQICRAKNKNCFINQAKKNGKNLKTNKNYNVKSVDFNSAPKYQIEIMDMSKEADNGKKYILVYRHLVSDYIQLRTLKNKEIQDIIPVLLDIFSIFGVPTILLSTLGLEFLKKLVSEIQLQIEWPKIKIIPGEFPNYSHCIAERDTLFEIIKNRLNEWKKGNNTCNWSKGVRFVQLLKNKTCTKTSRAIPHDWLFRHPFSDGLKSQFTESELQNINTEEDLKNMINLDKEGVTETSNNSFDDLNCPEKRQKLTYDNQKSLTEFCHTLFDNDLVSGVMDNFLVKQEPGD